MAAGRLGDVDMLITQIGDALFSPQIFMRISLSSSKFPNPSYKKEREN